MTEEEWLKAADPRPMLEFIAARTNQRKFRLYLCGGCQFIKGLLYSHYSTKALDVAERYADGLAEDREQCEAAYFAECPTFGSDFDEGFWRRFPDQPRDNLLRLVELGALSPTALTGGPWAVNESLRERLTAAAIIAETCVIEEPRVRTETDNRLYDSFALVDWPGRWLVDCVFGNPFHPVTVAPSWLSWSDATVPKIAQSIYDDRRFDELPILADALEEAGCSDPNILGHLRGPGPHIRGCWVVDLILGRS